LRMDEYSLYFGVLDGWRECGSPVYASPNFVVTLQRQSTDIIGIKRYFLKQSDTINLRNN